MGAEVWKGEGFLRAGKEEGSAGQGAGLGGAFWAEGRAVVL